MEQPRSDQRAICITGASRGIGRFLAETFLDRQWVVFGCSRGASGLKHERYRHFPVDVADESNVIAMFTAIRQSGQPLYALINNAGIASMNHALTTPAATMEQLFRVNALGTMLCSREAAKQMLQRHTGRIVNFATVALAFDLEGESAYVASKAAVVAYTRVLAREVGVQQITVNAIAPNPVKTDLIAGVPKEKLDRLVGRQVNPRYGTVHDVLRVVDFFLDPANDLITGQVIYLGGF
jgi:3-oxoacyl-[acyl-carrier protein] reductase